MTLLLAVTPPVIALLGGRALARAVPQVSLRARIGPAMLSMVDGGRETPSLRGLEPL